MTSEDRAEYDREDKHGVCPECEVDWYRVMEHDETMDRENVNFCPQCGTRLDE